MRSQLLVVGLVAVLASAVAEAQPAPLPWYRLTLADGRTVDGQFVGGDAVSYYVQTSAGVFSIQRTQVIGSVLLGPPAPPAAMPAQPPQPQMQQPYPMQQPPAMQQPPGAPPRGAMPAAPPPQVDDDKKKGKGPMTVVGGLIGFGASYGLTVVIARSRSGNDPDAKAGYIPIIGPVIWSASDDGKWGEDGWDWLSLLVTAIQGGCVYGAIDAIDTSDPPKKPKKATAVLTPVGGDGFRGVVFSGSF